jgi:RimJ/RimL family protein N-acetyltransferase
VRHPADLDELRRRDASLTAGSGDPNEDWLNWIVRRRSDDTAIGTVQATITRGGDGERVAEIAWVIGVPWQGQGCASEAASAVAARAGLHPNDERVDGETVWQTLEQGDGHDRMGR